MKVRMLMVRAMPETTTQHCDWCDREMRGRLANEHGLLFCSRECSMEWDIHIGMYQRLEIKYPETGFKWVVDWLITTLEMLNKLTVGKLEITYTDTHYGTFHEEDQ